jgi:hypothetical protein
MGLVDFRRDTASDQEKEYNDAGRLGGHLPDRQGVVR